MTRNIRPVLRQRNNVKKATKLAAKGYVKSARAIIRAAAPGVVVIEVNSTKRHD